MANGTWIDRKDEFDTSGGRLRRNISGRSQGQISNDRKLERVYSVAQVADLLAVTKQTIYKFLSLDEPDLAIIDPADWFKLPNGHIRIRQKAIERLMDG